MPEKFDFSYSGKGMFQFRYEGDIGEPMSDRGYNVIFWSFYINENNVISILESENSNTAYFQNFVKPHIEKLVNVVQRFTTTEKLIEEVKDSINKQIERRERKVEKQYKKIGKLRDDARYTIRCLKGEG